MKKILVAITAIMALGSASYGQTWINDSLTMGMGTGNDVFYSMNNGIVRTEDNKNWHMAFTMSAGDSSGIWANHNSGNNFTKVFNTHKDSSQWNTITLADTASSTVCFNNHDGWYSGAFNNKPGVGPFDFGWGKYDPVSHNIIGDSIFIVRVSTGYYKVWIKQLVSTQMEYTVQVGDMATNQTTVYTVARSPKFMNRLMAYFNLSTGVDTNREPEISSWDLLFTRYTTDAPGSGQFPNNNVIGTLSNKNVKVARAQNIQVDTAFNTYYNFAGNWATHIAGVGYNWKSFDMSTNTWAVADSNSYFVEDRAGNLWQMQFTAYSGSATGNINLRKRIVAPTSVNDVASIITKYSLSPNPSNHTLHIAIDAKSTSEAQLVVIDMSGRVLTQKNLKINNGLNAFNLPVSQWSQGQYLLQIKGDNIQIAEFFIVNH